MVEKNFKVFLADAELRKNATDEYGKVIDEALEAVDHFILFASKPEYVLSPYVANEWRIFIEEKRSGRKKGNLLTILKGLDVRDLPISLRHHQNFPYSEFRGSLLYYIQPINSPVQNQLQWEPAINELSKQVKFLKLVSLSSITLLVLCVVSLFSLTRNYSYTRPIELSRDTLILIKLDPNEMPLSGSGEVKYENSINSSKIPSTLSVYVNIQ